MSSRCTSWMAAGLFFLSSAAYPQTVTPQILYSFPYEPYTNCTPVQGVQEMLDGSLLGQAFKSPNNSHAFNLNAGALSYYPTAGDHLSGVGVGPFSIGAYSVDRDGKIWGVWTTGGRYQAGMIVTLDQDGTARIVHEFGSGGSADGSAPVGPLVSGRDGKLYGTTGAGGGFGSAGTIYRIDPETGGLEYIKRFLLSSEVPHYVDGAGPGPLTLGVDGSFYGATRRGGYLPSNPIQEGSGVIFKVDTRGRFSALHTFEYSTHLPGSPPASPGSPVAQTDDGTLYGTAAFGGKYGTGAIWKLTRRGGFTYRSTAKELGIASGLQRGPGGRLWGNSSYYLYSVDNKLRSRIEGGYNSPLTFGGNFPMLTTSRNTLVVAVPDGGNGFPDQGAGCGYIVEFSELTK